MAMAGFNASVAGSEAGYRAEINGGGKQAAVSGDGNMAAVSYQRPYAEVSDPLIGAFGGAFSSAFN
jgi:hypothetical protein